ncbi:MAG: N-acetylmuramoyl-L-alanine amidase [Roseinatronobacter sp.]
MNAAQIAGARWHPSPNFGPRRDGQQPRLIVLHYTGMSDCAVALERLCDPKAEVSAHYLIDRDGSLWQMVRDEDRAWHAGAGAWQGQGDVNSRSLGIELVNNGFEPFPWPQMRALEQVLAKLIARWRIAPVDVIAHSDMAPARKEDPGPRFDWRGLAATGLVVWPEGEGEDAPFAASLDALGYPEAEAEKRLQAFRFRFRPFGAGPESAADRARAHAVSCGFSKARK